MKTVFSSHNEVCHIFAQQSQTQGKSGNIFFYEKRLFSYGQHFIMAEFISPDNVLFSTRTYSPSTGKHLSIASRALSHKNIIRIYQCGLSFNDLLKHYTYEINDNLRHAAKAIKNRDNFLSYALHNYEELKNYCDIIYPKKYNTELKHLKKLVSFPDLTGIKKAILKEKEEEKQRLIFREKAMSEKITLWKNNDSDYLPFTDFIYLRIKNNFVETSHGARVSLSSARILYALITAKKSINGHKIDNYTVVSYLDGILKIGCHKIPQSEIERISPLLK